MHASLPNIRNDDVLLNRLAKRRKSESTKLCRRPPGTRFYFQQIIFPIHNQPSPPHPAREGMTRVRVFGRPLLQLGG